MTTAIKVTFGIIGAAALGTILYFSLRKKVVPAGEATPETPGGGGGGGGDMSGARGSAPNGQQTQVPIQTAYTHGSFLESINPNATVMQTPISRPTAQTRPTAYNIRTPQHKQTFSQINPNASVTSGLRR